MKLTRLSGTPRFWNGFSHWYEKWIERGEYHRPLVNEIAQMVEPGWTVLDIGAATGPLSIPLASLECNVTALEPCDGMRQILESKIESLGINNIDIRPEYWEEFDLNTIPEPDLVIASNCMHLIKGGIMEGMSKVFKTGARYICLVTEVNEGVSVDFKHIDTLQSSHNFLYIRNYELDSSFYFEDREEGMELNRFLDYGLDIVMEEGMPVNRDSTDIAVIWWERKK